MQKQEEAVERTVSEAANLLQFPRIKCWLFGSFRVERYKEHQNDLPIYEVIPASDWKGEQHRAMIKFLLLSHQRFARKEMIQAHIWPNQEQAAAKVSYSKALARFQELFGPDLLSREEDQRGLMLKDQSIIWCDADECLRLLKLTRYEEESKSCIELLQSCFAYFQRGTLLEGDDYEWVQGRRATFEMHKASVIERLVELFQEQGRLWEAENVLLAVLEKGLDEEALCTLMALYATQNNYGQALKIAERMRARCRKEGEVFPQRVEELASYIAKRWQPLQQLVTPQQEERPTPPVVQVELLQRSIQAGGNGIIETKKDGQDLVQHGHRIQFVSSETPLFDIATWLGIRVSDLKTIDIPQSESVISCYQQQMFVHEEIQRWDTMIDQSTSFSSDYILTRRTALATLASVPTALLKRLQSESLTSATTEEFLTQSASSITACWHLLGGNGLSTIEHVLPQYIPFLTAFVQQSSTYRKRASYLASQGYLLLSLLSLHRLRFLERVLHCKRAVEYAQVSGDQVLLVTALTHLGDAFFTNGDFDSMLTTYKKAEQYAAEEMIPSFLQSKVFAELSHAYARQGNRQETVRCLSNARSHFVDESSSVPVFLSTDYGLFQLILFEGVSLLDVGIYEINEGKKQHAATYINESLEAFSRIDTFQHPSLIPTRINVEITNQRALASVYVGDLSLFEKYLVEGIEGAKALASEKRQQEARRNWKEARRKYPHEKRIIELADLVI